MFLGTLWFCFHYGGRVLIVGTPVASYVSTNALMTENSFIYGNYPAPMLIPAAVITAAGLIVLLLLLFYARPFLQAVS